MADYSISIWPKQQRVIINLTLPEIKINITVKCPKCKHGFEVNHVITPYVSTTAFDEVR